MPLRKALLEAPLSSGLSQKTDIRSLQVDGAAVMTNCVRAKSGAVHKRFGCKQLSNTVLGRGANFTEFNGIRGLNYGRSPLLFDGYTFSQYSDSRSGWTLIDSAPEAVALDHLPVSFAFAGAGLFQGADFDFCASLNYYVCVGQTLLPFNPSGNIGGVISTIILDATSGAIVQPAFPIDTYTGVNIAAIYPKVIVCGTTAIAAWVRVNGATPGLYLSKLDLTNIGGGWTAPLLFDVTSTSSVGAPYDIAPMSNDTTRFLLGYAVAGAASNTKFVTVNPATLTAVHTFTNSGTTGTIESIAVLGTSGEWCWLTYGTFTGSNYVAETWAFNDANNAQISPFVWASSLLALGLGQIGLARVSATQAVGFFSAFDLTNGPPYLNSLIAQQLNSAGGGAIQGPLRRTPGVMLASRPAVISTPAGIRCYAMVLVNSTLQGTQALVCFDWFGNTTTFGNNTASDVPARLVSVVSPRLAKVLGPSTTPGGAIYPTRLVAVTPTLLATMTYINTALQRCGIFIQPFDFASKLQYFGGTIAGSNVLGVSSGVPFTFDGQTPAEMGFLWYPEINSVSGVAGSMTGTFSYIATYEWTDAIGNIHRSATSPAVSITTTSQNVVLTIPTIGVTWRARHAPSVVLGNNVFQNESQNVKICIYRTANGGTTYFQIASLENDTSKSSITYTDAGGALSPAILLYTTGGVLDNYCPPSSRICVTHKNRWFLSGCDDPTTIWPSKAFTSGEIPGFNEQMNFSASGAVRAMASLDEKLIIFVQRGNNSFGIEYIIGEGPFDTGVSNDWTNPPQPLPHAVGAIDQRSIAVCELGVFFFSPVGGTNGQGGIFLLSRDLQVTYVSGAVEDTIQQFPVCTGAAVHPNAGRIYFEFSATDAAGLNAGRRLVYDYLAQCWSTDTHYLFSGAFDGIAARTTFVAGGQGITGAGSVNMPLVHWVDGVGQVYRETSGFQGTNQFLDVSVGGTTQWITSTFTSAWFKPALSGFARFWRVQIQSDTSGEVAGLAFNVQFDYAPAVYYTEGNSWTSTQIAAFDRTPQCDVEHTVGNQKAKAIQVTLVDLPPVIPSSTARGFFWATISIEVGVEDGGRYQNLPSGQRG